MSDRSAARALGRSGADGAAVVLLVLLLAGLSGLGLGLLSLATRHATGARAVAEALQARLAADAGIYLALSTWPSSVDQVQLGAPAHLLERPIGVRGRAQVGLERLDREVFLLRSRGTTSPGSARAWSVAAVWALDPVARIVAAGAVVAHGRGLLLGSPASLDPELPGEAVDASRPECVPWAGAIDSLFPSGRVEPDRALPTTEMSDAWDESGRLRVLDPWPDGPERPGLGWVPMDRLLSESLPLTTAADTCPDDAAGCEPTEGVFRADPGSRLTEGRIRGVLVVDGDLTLAGSVEAGGWVLSSGNVTLEDRARFGGVLIAAGRVRISDLARVVADPCAAAASLDLPWLRMPRFVPGGWGIGPPR